MYAEGFQTHLPSEERWFPACEINAFALSVCPDQCNVDVIESGGQGQIASEHSHFIVNHCHPSK